jgi:hypothetical protein
MARALVMMAVVERDDDAFFADVFAAFFGFPTENARKGAQLAGG